MSAEREPTPREALTTRLGWLEEYGGERHAALVVDALDAYLDSRMGAAWLQAFNAGFDDGQRATKDDARHRTAAEAAVEERDQDRIWPCDHPGCTTMRTAAEGGSTFTLCEEHMPKPRSAPTVREEGTPPGADAGAYLRGRIIETFRDLYPDRGTALPENMLATMWAEIRHWRAATGVRRPE